MIYGGNWHKMNYSPEQATKHNDVEHIIQQVFNISGVKLTADDPIVAVLLLQEKNQSESFIQLEEETQKLITSVSEIKKYREQVLIELMNEAKRTSEQSEAKMIGLLGKYLADFETSQTQLHHKLLISRFYLLAVGLAGMIAGIVLHAIF